MNWTTEKFNLWIKRHKLFAIAAPIVILLSVFFVTTSINSMVAKDKILTEDGGYNNFLPDQNNELDVKEPNDIYKKSIRDSLEALNKNGLFKNILDTKKENDSLARILDELNNFSLDDSSALNSNITKATTDLKQIQSTYVDKKTEAQEKLEYRKLLMEARDERLSRSQDYSAPYVESQVKANVNDVSIKAAVYRDQFILPGSRVTLILEEGVFHDGNHFPKNSFVYATSNIQGSRVLLDITNINNVRLPLIAKDQQDGMVGLHNERAGELFQEFKTDVQDQSLNELSDTVGEVTDAPLAKNLVRSFGNFFKKKKYKLQDKILLVNGDRVFLTTINR